MIETETLRKAQLIMLEMLVEFDAVCQKYQLQYWLDSGTLLGAARHQGFIPWDDDIDIAMPIEHYMEFLQVAKADLSADVFLQNKSTDPSFKFDYTKLRSNKASIVEFHEKDKSLDYHQGVFVDIFPMLCIENTPENKHFYEDSFQSIREVSAVSLHTPSGQDKPLERMSMIQALKKRHQGWLSQDNKVIYSGEMPDVAAWFDASEIFPLTKVLFEGKKFSAPANSSHYLDAIYRFDYRQLPPEEQRVIHAHSISLT